MKSFFLYLSNSRFGLPSKISSGFKNRKLLFFNVVLLTILFSGLTGCMKEVEVIDEVVFPTSLTLTKPSVQFEEQTDSVVYYDEESIYQSDKDSTITTFVHNGN
jgi:hypothetical protein